VATLKNDFDEILKLTQQLEDKLSSFRIKLSNKNTDLARDFVGDSLYSYRKDYLRSLLTFKKRHYNKLGENKMAKKKKLDEGMVMIASLLPVGGLIGMPPKRKDNFVYKGLPGQFNENGDKVLDEMGNKIELDDSIKEDIYFQPVDGGGDTKIYEEIMKHWKAMGASIDKLSKKEPIVAKRLKKEWQIFGRKMSGL